MRDSERRNAYSVYLIFAAASAFFYTLVFTVSAVYRVEQAGLNPFQLVLVGTVLEASVFLFEIPTGVVADVYSRRLSVIIGVFLIGAGFLLEGALPIFWTILLAQALWGIGYTFTSGAVNAWISDEIGEERAGRAFLRGTQLGQAGALLATGVSVALASVRLNLPILAAGGASSSSASISSSGCPNGTSPPGRRRNARRGSRCAAPCATGPARSGEGRC